MRTAGAAYKLNDATKSALAGAATAAGAAGPLLTGLNLVLSFAEFHRELFCVVLDVGENITQQLRADWAATDLAVVTSGGFTRVYGWLWDITTQTVTGGGHGALDQVESFTVGLGWPRDLENSVRQLWA